MDARIIAAANAVAHFTPESVRHDYSVHGVKEFSDGNAYAVVRQRDPLSASAKPIWLLVAPGAMSALRANMPQRPAYDNSPAGRFLSGAWDRAMKSFKGAPDQQGVLERIEEVLADKAPRLVSKRYLNYDAMFKQAARPTAEILTLPLPAAAPAPDPAAIEEPSRAFG